MSEQELIPVWKELEKHQRHIHDQRNSLQELTVNQAVHAKMIENNSQEIQRLHRDGIDRHEKLTLLVSDCTKKIDQVITVQATQAGNKQSNRTWVPVVISLLSLLLGMLGIFAGLKIAGV